MNHAITLGGLLLTLLCVGGLGMAGIGLLMIFAGGMSDVPSEGTATSNQGCIVAAVGAVLAGVAIWEMLP